jgi:hypothetical protein
MNDFNNLAPDPSVPGGEETCQTGSKTAQVCQRELDALVAEKVMGWGWVRTMGGDIHNEHIWLMPPEEARRYLPDFRLMKPPVEWREQWRRDLPHYSTDIAKAWLVVEKMREQAWRLDIGSYYQDHHGWSACFDNYSTYFRSDAPTAPRAICLAALKAVGVDVSNSLR